MVQPVLLTLVVLATAFIPEGLKAVFPKGIKTKLFLKECRSPTQLRAVSKLSSEVDGWTYFHATHQQEKPIKRTLYIEKQKQEAEAACGSSSVGRKATLAQSMACDLKVKHATAAEMRGIVTKAK